MTITIGSWGIPVAITVAFYLWAFWPREGDKKNGDYDFAFWIPAAFRLAAATILSLIIWLAWSVAR